MFGMLHVTTPSELRDHSRKVGVAPIRRMHDWVNANARSDLSTDIRWSHGEVAKKSILFQAEEAARLALIVESTSDQTFNKMTVSGFLRGADLDKRTFHISFPEVQETEDIHGHMAKAFVPPQEMTLDKRYEADLTKYTMTYYAMDKDDEWWELDALRPIAK
jgi:hypothetical protein